MLIEVDGVRMAAKRNWWLVGPGVALALCVAGSLLTRGAMGNLQFLNNGRGGAGEGLVDQRPLQTAEALLPLAVSAEEQGFAQEAFRIADHEVDQAFAMALRQAAAESRTLTGEALQAQQKVVGFQATVKADQAAVDALTAKGGASSGAQADDLEVAKTQLALDTDELTDAENNLAMVSGDRRAKIQEELATHEAGMKKYDDHTAAGQVAVISSQRYGTLAGRVKAWFDQRSRRGLLEQAKSQADADGAALAGQRGGLQGRAATSAGVTAGGIVGHRLLDGVSPMSQNRDMGHPAVTGMSVDTRLAGMRRLEAQRNILSILDDRIEGQKELSANYAKWLGQLALQHRIVVHLLLNSLAWVALIVLCAVAAALVCRRVIDRRMEGGAMPERRSLQTMRTVVQFGIEALGLLLLLLVVFGAPSQVPTILGLATAGLTVVFQDHILAFFGWFVLMARNGIRVGDWVEIAGVGGEVVEVGLFRTTLLETGNWTDKGHPTGRRISFVNKFAMSGQYFNFTTDGQWMWDEITVNLPANEDVFGLVERMQAALVAETTADTAEAESEWQRATQRHGLSQFSAKPTVEMRPAAAGVDVVIRYVTRAAERLEMRNRLSQAVIRLLHVPGPALGAVTV